MRLIVAWLEGSTPLLLNRPTEESLGVGASSRRVAVAREEDPRMSCEKRVYRLGAQLALPGSAVARLLREAGSYHKSKGSRRSLKYIIPAAVLVLDDLVGLYLQDRKTPITDFEIDSRPVTIPATKGRVMRHRARLNSWAAKATLRINEDLIDVALVRQLLSEGLLQIGLGDFRPEKGGPFGTGSLTSWEEQKVQPLTIAQRRNSRVKLGVVK